MFNSIRKKVLVNNGMLMVILMLVLVFCLVQLNSNQKLLAEEEAAVNVLTEIAEIEETFIEFRMAGTEFVVLLQNSSKAKRDQLYKELHEIFNNSEHPEIF